MAEVTPSSKDLFVKAPVETGTSVVAPPKFLFGSGMSERTKKSDDGGDSDLSDKEDQMEDNLNFLEYGSTLKRSADSGDDADDFSPVFPWMPKKVMKTEKEQKVDTVLRPSTLSKIASQLNQESVENIPKSQTDAGKQESGTKTQGESSNSSSSSESTTIARPHLIDTPAQLNAGPQSQNYFQQFLSGKSLSSSSDSTSQSFVFGQNIRERVVEPSDSNSEASEPTGGEKTDNAPNSLSELAANETSQSNMAANETSQNSIAAAAEKYESEHSPKKQNLAEVHVMTGEEDERTVIQVNCRLFLFCKDIHDWLGKGRVILKLNDLCQVDSDGILHSRLVARTHGSLRLVLNTKLWPDMVLEKASEKAIRFSATENGNVNLYLIMAPTRETMQLFTAMDRRIRTLQRSDNHRTKDEGREEESPAETTQETKDGTSDDNGKTTSTKPELVVREQNVPNNESC